MEDSVTPQASWPSGAHGTAASRGGSSRESRLTETGESGRFPTDLHSKHEVGHEDCREREREREKMKEGREG